MKYYISTKEKKEKKQEKRAIQTKAKDGILLVFSMCLLALFISFLSDGRIDSEREQNDEIISVFKETPLYDFLDMEMTEKAKSEGEVSNLEGKK